MFHMEYIFSLFSLSALKVEENIDKLKHLLTISNILINYGNIFMKQQYISVYSYCAAYCCPGLEVCDKEKI